MHSLQCNKFTFQEDNWVEFSKGKIEKFCPCGVHLILVGIETELCMLLFGW